MGLFRKSRALGGWRAINFEGGNALAAHIDRPAAGQPVVSMIASEPMGSAKATEVLGRMAKSWQGQALACTTAVSAANYEFLPVDAPNVPATELKSAISWTISSMSEFSNEESIIDVLSVPHDKAGSQRTRAMYAVVARAALANEIQRCFLEAKLPLKVIDIPEMAQRNIAALLESEGRALALVAFDGDGGLLTFTSGGELYLARRIAVTDQQLLTSNADERASYQEAVALEIQRSLDHFGRQFSWVGTERLLVAPLGEADGGLVEFLAANLDTPVAALDLATVLDVSRVPELKNLQTQQKYFTTLGLALRHEEKVL